MATRRIFEARICTRLRMTQRLQDHSDASEMALKQLMQLAHQQGVVMAFADVLLLLTWIFVALAVLCTSSDIPMGGWSAWMSHCADLSRL